MKTGACVAAAVLVAAAGACLADEPSSTNTSPQHESWPRTTVGDDEWPSLNGAGRLLGFLDDGTPPGDRFWVRKEALLWWIKDGPRGVPLATTGPAPAHGFTPLPGFLGEPGTRTVLGGDPTVYPTRFGGRFVGGLWLDDEKTLGLEANYLLLEGGSASSSARTSGLPGAPNLAIPYYDLTGAAITPSFHPQNHVPGEAIWALPGPLGGFRGLLGVRQPSRLQGTELNALIPILGDDTFRLTGLTGFRWLQVDEDLTFSVATQGVAGGPSQGSFFNSIDKFPTQNNFFGGQLGARGEYQVGKWSFLGMAEIAFGDMHQTADVSGFSRTSSGTINYATTNTAAMLLPGGIFAQRTNGGSHVTDRFAVVPEGNLTVGYQITRSLRISIGYTFLFASALARPGDELDRRINSTLTGLADASRASGRTTTSAGGPLAPAFHFQDTSFWAQGLTFAVQCRF